MKLKNVCVVTGARSEYGVFRLLLKKIIASTSLKLTLLVTGMHLLKKYGNTIDFIKDDLIPIEKIIPMYEENDSERVDIGKAVGRAIINFSEAFQEINPDLLLVLGDRYEPLAAVIAASAFSIPIAHIHGGDNVSQGQTDEQIRHSITKFSHIHFPATSKSAERIKLMGEEEMRIYMVGSPSIDMIYEEKLLNKKELCQKFQLNESKRIILCLQHPYVFEPEKAGEQMKTTLEVLMNLDLPTIILYPNNDLGSELIIEQIEFYKDKGDFRIYKSLNRIDYLSFLGNTDLLIGNSSSGLIESPIFKLPVVNIGNRNKGRESAENVINVCANYDDIIGAVKKALSTKFKDFCKMVDNPYGDGKASEKIVKILEKIELNKSLLAKQLTYNV